MEKLLVTTFLCLFFVACQKAQKPQVKHIPNNGVSEEEDQGENEGENNNENEILEDRVEVSDDDTIVENQEDPTVEVEEKAPEFGLTARNPRGTCTIPQFPSLDSEVDFERVWQGVSLSTITGLFPDPQNNTVWYAISQLGTITKFDTQNAGNATIFLDLRGDISVGSETGLLGFAFHPQYPQVRKIYLNFNVGGPLRTRVASFDVNADLETVDESSQVTIIEFTQPASNHNAGSVAFGPDGYLYISAGDGGGGGDPFNHGQNLDSLHSAILRLDVDRTENGNNYAIPADNPFVGKDGLDEIYAYGLRNPWKMSFDTGTGRLWAADVGQDAYEEVNIIEKGGNYGWSIREAAHCFNRNTCSTNNLIDPVVEYPHSEGQSITGGFVYRGSAVPSLVGSYIFGDYQSGRVWAATLNRETGKYDRKLLLTTTLDISSFAQGNDGEIYIVHLPGSIYKIIPQGEVVVGNIPEKLSQSGCFDANDPKTALEMMIPYEPSAKLWSDGATKRRWFVMPDTGDISVAEDGHFDLPNGVTLVKEFTLGGKIIETRFLTKNTEGEWYGYTYEWNDEQTDADLLKSGKLKKIAGQDWLYPDRADCFQCHTTQSGVSLGLNAKLQDYNFVYPNRSNSNQLANFYNIGLFGNLGIAEITEHVDMVDLDDANATAHIKAASWLDANCASCHRPQGTGRGDLDLRFVTLVENPVPEFCNKDPETGDLGIQNAKVFAPGDPERSILYSRISRNDTNRMPPIGSYMLHEEARTVVRDWINSVQSCN